MEKIKHLVSEYLIKNKRQSFQYYLVINFIFSSIKYFNNNKYK